MRFSFDNHLALKSFPRKLNLFNPRNATGLVLHPSENIKNRGSIFSGVAERDELHGMGQHISKNIETIIRCLRVISERTKNKKCD